MLEATRKALVSVIRAELIYAGVQNSSVIADKLITRMVREGWVVSKHPSVK